MGLIYFSTEVKLKKENHKREVEISIDVAVDNCGELLYADICEVTDINIQKKIRPKDIEGLNELENEIYEFSERNTSYLIEEYTENFDDDLDEAQMLLKKGW